MRHAACVYIGPAALCPNSEGDRPYVLITGDQDDWVEPLIRNRIQRDPENDFFALRHNTIGKPGTTKTWHSFNHPSLNGIIDEETIRWCNPGWEINYLDCKEVENKKLQDILSETKLVKNTFQLVIAQGDPLLTLKRSAKLLRDCLSIDLSLHPLALVWKNSVDEYLTQQGFKRRDRNALTWQRKEIFEHVEALSTPSESEHFLSSTVQYLLNTVNLEEIRATGFGGSDLFLLQQVVLGKIEGQKKPNYFGKYTTHSLRFSACNLVPVLSQLFQPVDLRY